ncbi:MAG: 16S rRNA (uracil(1498)-N(3))-methyltransferase [Candidatus Reconcilbacillus cellulovorans]|uniref:Ribosomal RNA small subunit methyltransferase E n=1 Tax=Candidatus Reconcilbacillus cellulovorans TaxID=1906605 RepID=A0A2A6E028_9BACL|nr:MAG: 16S rRNA (uracil(1498)-N(3))-methyltransferase [Candidatus Reconcilbacillus cellulovorans]
MQKYFVDRTAFGDRLVTVTGDDARHICVVMRLKPGDRIVVSDGGGREAIAELTAVRPDCVEAVVVERLRADAEPKVDVWIAQSLPKGDKFETVLQKGTEIGAGRFLPFRSERTVVRYEAEAAARKLDRWRKIVKEAAEQAGRNRVPPVDPPMSWDELLARVAQVGRAWLLHTGSECMPLREAFRRGRAGDGPTGRAGFPSPVMLIVGPEGGFSDREAEQAVRAGALPVSLGRRVLRTETAAMVALACLMYEIGEMGGEPDAEGGVLYAGMQGELL